MINKPETILFTIDIPMLQAPTGARFWFLTEAGGKVKERKHKNISVD